MAVPPITALPPCSKKGIFGRFSDQVDKTLSRVDNYFIEKPEGASAQRTPRQPSASPSANPTPKATPRQHDIEHAQVQKAAVRARQAATDLRSAQDIATKYRDEIRQQEAQLMERQTLIQAIADQLEEASKNLESERSGGTPTSAGGDGSSTRSTQGSAFGLFADDLRDAAAQEDGSWSLQKLRQWGHRPLAQVPVRQARANEGGSHCSAWCGDCTFAQGTQIRAIDTIAPDAPASLSKFTPPSRANDAFRLVTLPSPPVVVGAMTDRREEAPQAPETADMYK